MIIKGNTVSTTMPRADYAQTDPTRADFIQGKPDAAIAAAQSTADNAKEIAEAALPKSGGTMTGAISMGSQKITDLAAPETATDAASKGYVDGRKAAASAVLTTGGWSSKKQTVSVPGVTATNNVLVTAAPESYVAYGEAVVYCSGQGDGTLSFTCTDVPTANLTVNILIMN